MTQDNILAFFDNLENLTLNQLDVNRTCFVCVDIINAFCKSGALASNECAMIVSKVAKSFKTAHEAGFRNFVFLQDMHNENALEFESFPPHALLNSDESEYVDELKALNLKPRVFYKNSFSIAYNNEFDEFLKQNSHIDTFVVVGCCTDICVFSTILHLRCSANEQNIRREIFVLSSLVATYNAPNHDDALYNYIFLKQAKDIFNAKIFKDIV